MARVFWGGSFGASPFPISATSLKPPRKSLSLWQKHHDVHLSYAPTFVDSIKSCQTKQQQKQTKLGQTSSYYPVIFGELWIWVPSWFWDSNSKDCQNATPSFHPPGSVTHRFIHQKSWQSSSNFLGETDVRNDPEGHEVSGNNERANGRFIE